MKTKMFSLLYLIILLFASCEQFTELTDYYAEITSDKTTGDTETIFTFTITTNDSGYTLYCDGEEIEINRNDGYTFDYGLHSISVKTTNLASDELSIFVDEIEEESEPTIIYIEVEPEPEEETTEEIIEPDPLPDVEEYRITLKKTIGESLSSLRFGNDSYILDDVETRYDEAEGVQVDVVKTITIPIYTEEHDDFIARDNGALYEYFGLHMYDNTIADAKKIMNILEWYDGTNLLDVIYFYNPDHEILVEYGYVP